MDVLNFIDLGGDRINTIISLTCNQQILKTKEAPKVASGGVNENKVVFTFCPAWDGFTKTAVFYRNEEEVFHVLLDDLNSCVIPHEVTASPGTFYIGVFGVYENITKTSEVITYEVCKGAITTGTKPSEPTPDVYSQLLKRISEIEKNSVSDEKIEEVVEKYLSENPTESKNAVLYTEQSLTEEQKEQARANIGAMSANAVIALSKAQVNALDALFRAASYIEDVRTKYAAFCDAFGIVIPDEPSHNVVVESVKEGSVTFENNMLKIGTGWNARATLVPVGQYLKKGTTYKFSLGSIANTYYHGVGVLVAESAGKEFPYTGSTVNYGGVTEMIVNSGYMTSDFEYTPDRDNCVLIVNFKKSGDATMNENDYATIAENYTIEQINEPDVPAQDEIKRGSSGFSAPSYVNVNTTMETRAMLVPIGRYLTKGKAYRFSLGDAASDYYCGANIIVASKAGLKFGYADTKYDGVTSLELNTGWFNTDFEYPITHDNCILCVGFKKNNGTETMGESDYEILMNNFSLVEKDIEVSEKPYSILLHRTVSKLTTNVASLGSKNTTRMLVYASSLNDKRLINHNGEFWDNSGSIYSPVPIPEGAVSAVYSLPAGMKLGMAFLGDKEVPDTYLMYLTDTGWITNNNGTIDVTSYNDGRHYWCANLCYTDNRTIPLDFDESAIDIYFVDANGNRL